MPPEYHLQLFLTEPLPDLNRVQEERPPDHPGNHHQASVHQTRGAAEAVKQVIQVTVELIQKNQITANHREDNKKLLFYKIFKELRAYT
jgi:hypothetical protein